jgi:hypothetical protein
MVIFQFAMLNYQRVAQLGKLNSPVSSLAMIAVVDEFRHPR